MQNAAMGYCPRRMDSGSPPRSTAAEGKKLDPAGQRGSGSGGVDCVTVASASVVRADQAPASVAPSTDASIKSAVRGTDGSDDEADRGTLAPLEAPAHVDRLTPSASAASACPTSLVALVALVMSPRSPTSGIVSAARRRGLRSDSNRSAPKRRCSRGPSGELSATGSCAHQKPSSAQPWRHSVRRHQDAERRRPTRRSSVRHDLPSHPRRQGRVRSCRARDDGKHRQHGRR